MVESQLLDIASLQTWIGRTETRSDQVTAAPMAALAATLDRDDPQPKPGDPLPPLWHWLYFLPIHRQSELGADGHARLGGFLPPVPLPRRMWAGTRIEFRHALRVGEPIERVSRIANIEHKQGRTGSLVFVQVRHEIRNGAGVALVDEHDIVYRPSPQPGDPAPPSPPLAPADHTWQRTIEADDVLLFRYSALTFNGHRIHYDRRYVTEVEGYPGLVVHGPLQATLLADLLRRSVPNADMKRFVFRAMSPLFDTAPFNVCGKVDPDGRTVQLWTRSVSGGIAMSATATI
jgi:3-methylfumaryl-CoA hydratase